MPPGVRETMLSLMVITVGDMIITDVRYIIIGLRFIIILMFMFTTIIRIIETKDTTVRPIITRRLKGKGNGWIGNRQTLLPL